MIRAIHAVVGPFSGRAGVQRPYVQAPYVQAPDLPSHRSPSTESAPRLRRLAAAACAIALLAAGCGGGGSGGGGIDEGPASFAIPFVPTSGARDVIIGLRNLDDSTTTVELTAFLPDGTPYSLPVSVTIDGLDEEIVPLSTALGGFAPAGGVVFVKTPSRRVEAYFDVEKSSDLSADASRGFALPDLAAPPPGPYRTGVDATTLTTAIQVTNASGAAASITVTAYEESLVDPAAPPVARAVVLTPFAPGESRVFSPSGLSGVSGFVGSFLVESPTPVVAAAEEDLAFAIPRTATAGRTVAVAVTYGRDPATVSPTFLDFALVARNDLDASRTISITRISREDGSAIYTSATSPARGIALAAHEARAVTTTDVVLADLFGDVLGTSSLTRVSIEMSIPAGVDLGVRQFEPQLLVANTNLVPTPTGHVMIVSDVFPAPVLPSPVRTFAAIVNPTASPITVFVEALIPEPSGFDATVIALPTLGAGVTSVTVPAHGRVVVTPDGASYSNRDLLVADHVGLRFRSNAPLAVTAWREERAPSGAVETLVALPVRSLDDGD